MKINITNSVEYGNRKSMIICNNFYYDVLLEMTAFCHIKELSRYS